MHAVLRCYNGVLKICVFIIRPEALIHPYAISFPIDSSFFFFVIFSFFNGFSCQNERQFLFLLAMKSAVRVECR